MSMSRRLPAALIVLGLTTSFSAAAAAADAARIQWFGQSAFKIETPGGKTIVIDPFITQNPKTPEALKDLAALGPVDLILVTHGHRDHIGDTVEIAKGTEAKVALNADLGHTFAALGWLPYEQLIRFNKSGAIRPLGEGITVTMVPAEHSSEVVETDAQTGKPAVHPGGEPAGYVIELENGYTIYHAGDTGVFADMRLIADLYEPDLVLLPIGGHFTMGPLHAAYAVRTLLDARAVVPMHYGTFPALSGTPDAFRTALGDHAAEVIVMEPGEVREF
jgi:L-ascorbate metabolism protein UlaG (beta-lactamase superfamily)